MASPLAEVGKLERINALGLPADLFAEVSRKRLLWCKQRIAVEDLHEIRRHPEVIRSGLLAAFCHERKQVVTDTLIELLISIIHKIGSRAEHRVDKAVVKEVKRVQGKSRLLFDVAAAAIDHPDGKIREVIYPVAGEQTLREIIQEFKAIRQAQQVLDRRAAERARATLKEIRRLAAAAGYAVTFANTDVPSVHRAAVVAKLSCKRADLCSMFCHAHGPGAGR